MSDVISKQRFQSFLFVLCVCISLNGFAKITPSANQANKEAAIPKAVLEAPTISNYKSYREWKNLKITEIENRIKLLRERIVSSSLNRAPSIDSSANSQSKTEAGLNSELQDQLDQEMLNLSISQDLSISDYFVGYLTKQSSLNLAIDEVSARLTAEEVAELMNAFAQHISQTKSNPIKSAPRADFSTK